MNANLQSKLLVSLLISGITSNAATLSVAKPAYNKKGTPSKKINYKSKNFLSINKSIQLKMSIILVFVTTLLLSISGLFQYMSTKNEMSSDLDKLGEIRVNSLAYNLISPLWNLEQEQIKNVIKSDMLEKRIYGVLVYDTEGKKISYGFTRDDKWEVIEKNEEITEKCIIKEKVIQSADEQKLGIIKVYVTEKFMKAELKNAFYRIIWTVVALNFAIVGIISLSLNQFVIRPLHKVIGSLKAIAQGEGDLTQRLHIKSKDEIGELGKWFDLFIAKLHEIVKSIAEKAIVLDEASHILSNLAGDIRGYSENVTAKSTSVAGAAEETSVTMETVSNSMQTATMNIATISSSIEEITATINEIAKNLEKARVVSSDAVSESSASSESVNKLGIAAQEIGKVTETIDDISSQTNLLALNATIEAARAGDAGRGFSIVANEIKELSKQTADATLGIRQKIENIQIYTNASVKGITSISEVINNVNDIVYSIASAVEEQSVAIKEISSSLAHTTTAIKEVNRNVSQQTLVAVEIAKDISTVESAAGDMLARSTNLSSSSQELNQLAGAIKEMMGRFKI
ncbi:MAG: methyl-accepting chemotaxis protein [Desulfobacterales bacterium]|nr:methyl-accepting chemotaxis protein [Desulfobacterales bacterium]